MRELMIYKDICIKSEAFGGRAVGVSDMIGYYSFSKSTYYRALKKLIQHGFVTRIDRGMYLPVAIYKWQMSDAHGDKICVQ